LYGSVATLEIAEPWLPGLDGKRVHEISLIRPSGRERVTVESDRGLYAYEADHVASCIERREFESPDMTWADTIGNMAALDRWRRAVGVTYPAERPSSLRLPVDGGSLTAGSLLPRRPIAGVATPVSRIVLGTMVAFGDETWPTAMSVFDHFFEHGGNAFDTARRYGNGESDRALGQWTETRGVRSQVVVIAKGAHTPHCDPDTVTRELEESLDDLRTDYADLYFLHRDNPKVPVGEFVDVLNQHHRAGRIRAFGGSNWTAERVDEANRYAEQRGLVGFTALSNQFSLARMVRPTFPGCLDAAGEEWRAWLVRTGMPVVAWSSQAAGFFAADTGAPTARAWRDAGNLSRRDRTQQLAARKGVPATTIALAWVLAQPLPIFPIIGPRTLAELLSSLAAIPINLSPEESAWLDLQD
jgi:aryl-alcohol dehydrogenase-like predicted oxidoreductase